jgi:allophanate hydrolase subunit 2
LSAGKTFTLEAGEELHITGTRAGVCAYLCVRGGFHTSPILDSHSALEPLRAGAILTCSSGRIRPHYVREDFTARDEANVLRVVPGQQAEWFAADNFYGHEFTILPESDRMGLRLNGPPQLVPKQQLLSEPVCPGTVQVTSNGQCIILGRDGQTIGGYPKIAQVISADLDKLAQLRPSASIRFEYVTQQAAEQLFRERQRDLRNWLTRIRTAIEVDH